MRAPAGAGLTEGGAEVRWEGRGKSKVEGQVQKHLLEEVLVNRETQQLLRDFGANDRVRTPGFYFLVVLDLVSHFSETDSPSCRLRVGLL